MVSLKSTCATVIKGTGGFQHNGRVSVIISYGIMAKSKEKNAFPVADVQQFHGKITSILSLGGKDTCWAQGNGEGPHGLQFCRTPDPQTRKYFHFSCSGGLLTHIPYIPEIPATKLEVRRECRGGNTPLKPMYFKIGRHSADANA